MGDVIRTAIELFRATSTYQVAPRLKALRAGETAAVEELLNELLPRIRAWLFRRLGPEASIDDATQETLFEIVTALPRYQGRSSLDAYAYRISARVAARHLKGIRSIRDKHRKLAIDSLQYIERRDPERQVMQRELLSVIYRCLAALPLKRREAFMLCDVEGLTPSEAAQLAGTNPNAMRSRLMHARGELERRLRAHGLSPSGEKGDRA